MYGGFIDEGGAVPRYTVYTVPEGSLYALPGKVTVLYNA
jgi:hypothetical protein